MTQLWRYLHIYGYVYKNSADGLNYIELHETEQDVHLAQTISTAKAFSNDEEFISMWYASLDDAITVLHDLANLGWELITVTEQPIAILIPNQSIRSFPSYYYKIKRED